MTIERAREELRRAVTNLGRLAAEAATSGNYDETILIARWAASVADLVEPAGLAGKGLLQVSSPGPRHSTPDLPQVRSKRSPRQERAASRPTRVRTDRHTTYPRFERRRHDLVKIGWSKREKREYEQKAPKDVIDRIATELGRRATNGALMSTDELLPIIRPEDGHEIPTYQVYVVLAWLRAKNVVEAVGRQGYRVLAKDIAREIETIWESF